MKRVHTKIHGGIATDRGFTLVEIIVSLAIFTIVAVVAVGAFLKIIDANRKAQTLKTATNNINFALESITREMRVGSNFACYTSVPGQIAWNFSTNSCPNGDGRTVAFISSNRNEADTCNLVHVYSFVEIPTTPPTYTIKKGEQPVNTLDCTEDIITANLIPLISTNTIIDNFELKVVNPSLGESFQPRAFVRINGHTGAKERDKTYFDVQTTISQRNPY